MPKRYLILLTFPLAFSLIVSLLLKAKPTYSATNHVVVSEVQTGGSLAGDEFIELYNPTSSSVDLSGWKLTRVNSAGSGTNLDSNLSGTIASHGFYLITPPSDYDGGVVADETYSNTTNRITGNDTVILYDASDAIVDRVGMGTAYNAETSATPNPAANGSVERKARQTSTSESMGPGGEDELQGNAEDTDNNLNDFVVQNTSNPQNTSSTTESPFPSLPVTPPLNLVVILSGSNEVPPNTSTASGTANFTFDFTDNSFDLNVVIEGIALSDLTGSHIHVGAAGVAGPIIVDIGPVSSWEETSSISRNIQDMSFPSDFIDELLAGNTYINVHTSSYPDGEIRGQLVEATPTATETPTPTLTPTETPTPTQEPTPSEEPTPTFEPTPTDTPTPTLEPTTTPTEAPTPTEEPSPTQEPTPTSEPTPTEAPSPTQEPSPTLEPTPSVPTPTPPGPPTPPSRIIGWFLFPKKIVICRMNFIATRIGFLKVFLPTISCSTL